MSWVVDASVAVKWVIPEVLSDAADRVRDGEDDILAPDLLLVEVANALWRKTTAKEISPREADVAFELVRGSGIDLVLSLCRRPARLRRNAAALLPKPVRSARAASVKIVRSSRSSETPFRAARDFRRRMASSSMFRITT